MAFEIQLTQAGKRFNRDWIFRDITYNLSAEHAYVVLGGNGSGKSTLLRCLSGYAPLSAGSMTYHLNGRPLPQAEVYRHMSYCSPYLELYEELTVSEMCRFHFSLKFPVKGHTAEQIPELAMLDKARNRPVKHLSSGMKQRLRLALALYSDAEVVFLDEPTSNLDAAGIAWYKALVEALKGERLLIVASNSQKDEYYFCEQEINIGEFKP